VSETGEMISFHSRFAFYGKSSPEVDSVRCELVKPAERSRVLPTEDDGLPAQQVLLAGLRHKMEP